MLDNLKLGYGGTKTEMERLLKDAQAISGIEYNIDSYADVVEAIHVIQTSMDITGTTAKEAEHTISGSVNSMQGAIKNLITGFGRADADMGKLCKDVIDAFKSVVKNITPVIQNIVAALPSVAGALIEAVGELLPVLLQTVTGLFSEVLTTIVKLLPSLIPAAVQAIVTTVQGLIENLPMLLDAALQLIEGLVQGILDALPVLIEALPEIILAIVNFLLDSIPEIIDAGIKLLTSLVNALPQIIMNAYEIKTGLSRAKISHLMDAETWMNANKAMELGFIDDVLFREEVSDDDAQPAVPVMFSETAVMNSLMGKIAEKCRINARLAQPDVPQGRSVNELRGRLDTIKKFI